MKVVVLVLSCDAYQLNYVLSYKSLTINVLPLLTDVQLFFVRGGTETRLDERNRILFIHAPDN